MSRSISQIYSEALAKRNDYLQITELDSGRSNSKMSVMNIITYVMASAIYVYESILDVFEVNIAKLIESRINGTPQYYAAMAKLFQYNPNTGKGDELVFNEDTNKIEYKTPDVSHRIIERSAYQRYSNETGVLIKVCKANPNQSEENSPYVPLSNKELTAFKGFMDEIKFVGTKIQCLSIPGDLMCIKALVVYDDLYVTEEQAFDNVKAALLKYARNLEYNAYIYYQAVIDAIQSADYIVNVLGSGDDDYAKITLTQYNSEKAIYDEGLKSTLVGGQIAYSGYLTFIDEFAGESANMLQRGDNYLTFISQSKFNAQH